MNRRSTEQRGWVRFPTHLENSGEGGMYVQLVVVQKGEPGKWRQNEWMLCCSGLPQVSLNECLMSDGVHARSVVPEPAEGASPEAWREYCDKLGQTPPVILFHYPHFERRNESEGWFRAAHESIDYLAVITLGSTGWSNGEWHCTVEDLTEEGRALYVMMELLYREQGEIYLMTWLDT